MSRGCGDSEKNMNSTLKNLETGVEPKCLIIERSAESLCAEDIIALCRGQFLAVRISGFCPPTTCQVIASRLLEHPQLSFYPHAPSIAHVFDAFYEGYQNPKKREKYYEGVAARNHALRMLSWPHLNPMNHLQLLLDEIWPLGARREQIHDCPMAFGLAQIFSEGACALPHQDFLRMDEPDNVRAQTMLTQITAIVYTSIASGGGQLQLWHEHFNHQEFEARRDPASYGVDYAKIPPPALTITPDIGDLILADSTKVHAVTRIDEGNRIALNCFLGFRGISEPLTYWS